MKAKAAAAARVALLLALAVMAWRAMNYRSDYEPGPDSSIFMSAGWHALNGRVLYRDQLTGPPVIYALDAIALAIGGNGINSVRVMEHGFAVVGVAAFFVAAFLAFGRFWLAWTSSVLYLMHLYRQNVIEGGNVTEEYGGVFLLLGIAGAIAASQWSGRKRFVAGALAGTAFALAVLCKEPFVLIVPVWFAFFAWPRNNDWRDAGSRAIAFIAGAAVPGVAFVSYLVAHSAWNAWLDSISASLAYTAAGPTPEGGPVLRLFARLNEKVSPMLVAIVASALGIAGLFHGGAERNRRGLPLAIAASTVMSLWSVSIGGRYYGHYYMFFVGSFVLLCASGIAFATDVVSHNRRFAAGTLVAALMLTAADTGDIRYFWRNLAVPARPWRGNWLAEMIRRNTTPNDPIWTPWKPLLYTETRRLSPTRWQSAFDIYFVDTKASSGAEKFARLRAELASNPPAVIVISPLPGNDPARVWVDEFLARSQLAPWVDKNYQSVMCTNSGNTDVMVRKSSLSTLGATPVSNDSAAMFIGTVALYEVGDTTQALACFRRVLARTPSHYGATYQLAKALEYVGRKDDANPVWRKVLALARQFGDTATEAEALARLR